MKRYSRILLLTFICYFLYFIQGLVYPIGGIFSKGIILLIILIQLFYSFKTIFQLSRRTYPINWMIFFFILNILAYIFSPPSLPNDFNTTNQFKNELIFCTSILAGYYFGLKVSFSSKKWLLISILLLMMSVSQYFTSIIQVKEILKNIEGGDFTNNAAYFFVSLIPFLALTIRKHTIPTIIILGISFCFIIICAKRGATLCAGCMILYGLIWYQKNYGLSTKYIITIAILLIGSIMYVESILSTNDFIMRRLEDTKSGGTSGRELIWIRLLDYWQYKGNLFTVLFGFGTCFTTVIAGNFAHNDWLELLICNGIIGIIVYFGLILSCWMFSSRKNIFPEYRLAIRSFLICWILSSIFSMGYTSISYGIPMLMVGVLIGNIYSRKNTKIDFNQTYKL